MSKPNIASILGRLQGGQCNSDDYFAIVELLNDRERLIEASIATPPAQQPGEVVKLTPELIEAGWHETFSTNNPFCPCDLKSFGKAVRWAERALAPKEKGNG